MRLASILCATGLLLATPVFADEPPAPPSGVPGHPYGHQHMGPRFGEIAAKLQLTPAQQPLWDAYVGVVKAHGRARRDHFEAMRAHPPGDAAAQLDERLNSLNAEVSALEEEKQAFAPLWASLDETQKGILSQAMAWHPHGGWHDHGGWQHDHPEGGPPAP